MDLQADLYNKEIIRLAADVSRIGKLPRPDFTASAVSRLCGSKLEIELCLQQNKVSDFAYQVEACILGQAAAALIAQHIIGASVAELHALINDLRAMLRNGAPPPSGRFAALKILESAREYKTRHGSILLMSDGLETCLRQAAGQAAD